MCFTSVKIVLSFCNFSGYNPILKSDATLYAHLPASFLYFNLLISTFSTAWRSPEWDCAFIRP
ncbi:MAG: hypothetical protein K0R28_1239 [Paenibacillus sp.]|jgi:hypothetical protein|nr:hypothetical protein [Paenibacillus sp.]